MSKDYLRLICRCGTIYEVAELPLDVNNIIAAIHLAECPTCHEGSERACIYVEERNDLTIAGNSQD